MSVWCPETSHEINVNMIIIIIIIIIINIIYLLISF